MLNTTLQYRCSITLSNVYPALRLFMQVQPKENPVLFKVFYESCHRHETQYLIKITRKLFPSYEVPDLTPTTIPLEIVDCPYSDQNIVSLAALLNSTSREKQHFLMMALFEWNYLLQAIFDGSSFLMKYLRAKSKSDKIETFTFRERIDAANLIQEFLDMQFNIKDACILFHMLEYFRHLIVLKPSLFSENDFSSEQLEQLWKAFAINTQNHNS